MPRSVDVKVDMNVLEGLEALPVVRGGAPKKVPTPTQLEGLRRYWKSGRRQQDIADKLGVGKDTCLRWYRELIEAPEAARKE